MLFIHSYFSIFHNKLHTVHWKQEPDIDIKTVIKITTSQQIQELTQIRENIHNHINTVYIV